MFSPTIHPNSNPQPATERTHTMNLGTLITVITIAKTAYDVLTNDKNR